MEVIQHDGTTSICQATSYPIDVDLASGVQFGNSIVICGITQKRLLESSYCYIFGGDNQWKKLSQMRITRVASAAIFVSGRIWITGGESYERFEDSTEFIIIQGDNFKIGQPCFREYNPQ